MTKAERQKKYEEIARLAEWVNTNRDAIAREDEMNIFIGIADNIGIRRLCLTGDGIRLATMIQHLLEGASRDFENKYGKGKS